MGNQTSFPVFEADQVLTNNHLNDLRRYLDQQNRLTRSKLIGCGIVCGLEVTYSATSIKISEGCGLTSQGYLINLCDNEYTHYIPYTVPAAPAHIDFTATCTDDISNEIPFYKPAFDIPLLQLITGSQLEKLTAEIKLTAVPLATVNKSVLGELVAVAFLEAEEINLKNCDTNDCNDKGSRMDFETKVLLVSKAVLDKIQKGKGNTGISTSLPHISLRRYNVPVKNLPASSDVLTAFTSITDDPTIDSIHDALNQCYSQYSYLLETGTENPFGDVSNKLKAIRKSILDNAPVLIQYFYDFLDDIIKGYIEFRQKVIYIHSECCTNEFLFPLHLMLGEASVNTQPGKQSSYRQYFIYSPLFDAQNDHLNEIRFLFIKIKLLLNKFLPDSPAQFDRREIKITPDLHGRALLSERSIPYYYTVKDNSGSEQLFVYWNYKKTSNGEEGYNPGYKANEYTDAANIYTREPLRFDIENYNFFRVEGHIGKPIDKALSKIVQVKQDYNLPFDIIALSADYIGAILKDEDPQCVIQDLESNYRVVITEFMCKLHDAFCNIYKFDFKPKPIAILGGAAIAARVASPVMAAVAGGTAAINSIGTPDEDDEVNELISKVSFSGLNIDHPVLSQLVSEAHLTKTYVKGTSIQRLCGVQKGTIGDIYLSNITGRTFVNPVSLNTSVKAAGLYSGFFELIDSVESMFNILLTNELSELNLTEFRTAYARYEKNVKDLSKVLKVITDKVQIFLSTCIVEILEALKDEYRRRINQHLLAKRFNAYFKTHGGIEHKAGVITGGTFILVYHEETQGRKFDVNALFVNKNIGNLMLVRHPELLQPAAGTMNTDAAMIDLENAVSVNCPEQHLELSDSINNFLKTDNNISIETREALLKAINRTPDRQRFKFTQGMVIADFYIPYICCSDCPPVAYILPEVKPVPEPTPTPEPVESVPEKKNLSVCGNLKEFKLEPGLVATDIVKIIFNSGLAIKEQSLLALPSSSADKTTVFHVSYKINDKQTDLIITVVVPVTVFNINISSVADGNQQLINLELESIDKKYTELEWKIKPEPIAMPGTLKDDPLRKIRIPLTAIRELKTLHIEHIVTVQTDTGRCTATGVFDLPFVKRKDALAKKSFDNTIVF